jgi:two-component system sensor histidine kinase TorS
MKIAVIDDDPSMLAWFRALLSAEHDVCTFDDAASALDALPHLDPDLMLLDVDLGASDGMTLLAAMREVRSLATVPVIAMSGHRSAALRARLLADGCVDFIAKPIVDADLVLALIGDCLGGTLTPCEYDVFDEPTWPGRALPF